MNVDNDNASLSFRSFIENSLFINCSITSSIIPCKFSFLKPEGKPENITSPSLLILNKNNYKIDVIS